ncbi:MAG: 50S ribosomal protein L25/general stress protein Ctc [Micromonosporaceae bacterium]|nr:50S ribosomal protein L25/general stress protein Ctc [Micromonosporaceae bacterium]
MSEVLIKAESRTDFGKGGARRTRRAGKIPAVLYGHGEKPKHVALPALEFAAALRHGGLNQLFRIEIADDGSKALALPKALQRDPLKDTIDHVDLLLVRRGEKVTVEVPVVLSGEPAKGGLLVHDLNTLSISADATKLPDRIELSIEGMEVGSHIPAGQVTLPQGSELLTDPETVVVSLTVAPSVEQLEAELAEAEAEAGIEREVPAPAEDAASAGEAAAAPAES